MQLKGEEKKEEKNAVFMAQSEEAEYKRLQRAIKEYFREVRKRPMFLEKIQEWKRIIEYEFIQIELRIRSFLKNELHLKGVDKFRNEYDVLKKNIVDFLNRMMVYENEKASMNLVKRAMQKLKIVKMYKQILNMIRVQEMQLDEFIHEVIQSEKKGIALKQYVLVR